MLSGMAKKSDTPASESTPEQPDQPTKDAAGRDLGPGESPNTPDPADSIYVDDRYVQGSETVLMRGDRPDES